MPLLCCFDASRNTRSHNAAMPFLLALMLLIAPAMLFSFFDAAAVLMMPAACCRFRLSLLFMLIERRHAFRDIVSSLRCRCRQMMLPDDAVFAITPPPLHATPPCFIFAIIAD